MSRRLWIGVAVVLLGAAALGVKVVVARRAAAASAAAAASGAPAATAHPLELAAEDVLVLAPQALQRGVAVSGSVRAVSSAFIKAKVAGELLELGPREGDSVTAGQAVGRIDATEAEWRLKQAEHQVEAAQAQLDLARRQLDNNRALVGQGFISATALDASVSSDAAARANLQAAQAGVELARKALGDTRLVAPLAGQVAQRLAQPGERLALDARVLEVVDLGRLEVEAALPPDDAGQVRVGAPARLEVEGVDGSVAARVVRINPAAQAGTRAVLVYLALQPRTEQARALRNGLFARGTVDLGGARQALPALALSAVRVDRAEPYVLLLAPEATGAGTEAAAAASGTAGLQATGGGARARVVAQRVQLGAQGQRRAPAAAAAAKAAGTQDAPGRAAAEDWVEIRSGLPAGARVLAGRVGNVPEGSVVSLPATAAAATASVASASAATTPAATAAATRSPRP